LADAQEAVFMTLLSCGPILNTDRNLIFEDGNPFTAPKQEPSLAEGGYRKTYTAALVKTPGVRFSFHVYWP
jgi:hypothetical protein